jgi:hypothetical protein
MSLAQSNPLASSDVIIDDIPSALSVLSTLSQTFPAMTEKPVGRENVLAQAKANRALEEQMVAPIKALFTCINLMGSENKLGDELMLRLSGEVNEQETSLLYAIVTMLCLYGRHAYTDGRNEASQIWASAVDKASLPIDVPELELKGFAVNLLDQVSSQHRTLQQTFIGQCKRALHSLSIDSNLFEKDILVGSLSKQNDLFEKHYLPFI